MSNPVPALHAGRQIGNYILRERIGSGAFAEVWQAAHQERPSVVRALKIATHPDYRRYIAREGGLPEIKHPNVVPILDCNTRGLIDEPYVVMPYLPGGSLLALIRAHPRGLPEERCESILKDVLEGLSAAHALGIVHCDIKPTNILFDEAGRAVIVDFGLSSGGAAPLVSMFHSLSVTGNTAGIAGTMPYIAPEVRDDGAVASPAADVYAVGVLLFEMLVGRRPQGVELPTYARRDLHRGSFWDALFYWAYQPLAKRYPTAQEMLTALLGMPRRIPFAAAATAAPRAPLPEPAPLPEDMWDGLDLRVKELEAARVSVSTVRARRDTARRIYAEHHPEVRVHAEDLELLRQVELRARRELRHVQDRIIASLMELRRPYSVRWQTLEAEGLLPTHPEMADLKKKMAGYDKLIAEVSNFQELRCPLRDCLVEWQRVNGSGNWFELQRFLLLWGSDVTNPWAEPARRRIEELMRSPNIELEHVPAIPTLAPLPPLSTATRLQLAILIGAGAGFAAGVISLGALGVAVYELSRYLSAVVSVPSAIGPAALICGAIGAGAFGFRGFLLGATSGLFAPLLFASTPPPGEWWQWALGLGSPGGIAGTYFGGRFAARHPTRLRLM